ncbi:MAG: cytochrome ubiquinol oxidase subunit I [Polyangiaceae bacterium]
MDATGLHRLSFAFTITFHYLFPQLTMGLAFVIVVLKYLATYRGDELARDCARFLSKLFGLNFVMGVVTGIPMEFQFGASWSRFSEAAGGVIGQTLAMEGLFAFFLESSFLYLLLFGEKKVSPKLHFLSAILVLIGSWLSGFFIIVTNAWMQHPVGHEVAADGTIRLVSLSTYLTNPWAMVQFSHVITGSLVTASVVTASLGAFYTLSKRALPQAKRLLQVGVGVGAVATVAMAMPTGDFSSRMVIKHQPVTFAAMEGHFHTEDSAGMALVGQPDVEHLTLDNPIIVPSALSFMTYQRFNARIDGLSSFDKDSWPDNVPLLYYSYHVMVGLGTIMIALMSGALLLLRKGRLYRTKPVLWALMLAFPLPYIANTAGWMTAELGRQPWLIYGLMRTEHGSSHVVSSGNVLFALLGYMGLYAMLALLFFFLFVRICARGPGAYASSTEESAS